jgi:hypothetical protein
MSDEHPTNTDLQETMRKQEETIRAHTVEDTEQFEAIHARFDEVAKQQDAILKKLDPVVDVYKATLLNVKFITGLGSVVFAISAIGTGIFWIVQHLILTK